MFEFQPLFTEKETWPGADSPVRSGMLKEADIGIAASYGLITQAADNLLCWTRSSRPARFSSSASPTAPL